MNGVNAHISQVKNASSISSSQSTMHNKSMALTDNRAGSIVQKKVLEDNRPEIKSSVFSKSDKVINDEEKENPKDNKPIITLKGGTLADLHEPPVVLPRTKQQEKEDLLSVNKLLGVIAEKVKTTEEIAAYFPAIKERYQLTQINFDKSGTKGYYINISINPRYKFTDFANNMMNINRHEKDMDTPVYLEKTLTLPTGETGEVGMKMVDHVLTPSHLQGSSPKSSAQKDLFEGLPTKGKVPQGSRNGSNMYIKGHLLNDNLGGPGEDFNLFPITVQANDDHKRKIEADAKHLVNDLGLYVYYDVGVIQGPENKIPNNLSSVDATFVCHLSPLTLTTNGLEKKTYKKATIYSKYGGKVAPVVDPNSDNFSNTAGNHKQLGFDPSKVLWAPSHYRKKTALFTPETLKELEEFTDEADFLKEVQRIHGIADGRAQLAWKVFIHGRDSTLHGSSLGNETAAINLINTKMAEQQLGSGYDSARKGEALSGDETESFTNGHQAYHAHHAQGHQLGSTGQALPAGTPQGVVDGFHKAHHDIGYQIAAKGDALPLGATQGQVAGHYAYRVHHAQGHQLGSTGQALPAGTPQGVSDGFHKAHHDIGYQIAAKGDALPFGATQGQVAGHHKYIYDTHYAHGYQVARNGQHFLPGATQGQLDGYNAFHAQVAAANAATTGDDSMTG